MPVLKERHLLAYILGLLLCSFFFRYKAFTLQLNSMQQCFHRVYDSLLRCCNGYLGTSFRIIQCIMMFKGYSQESCQCIQFMIFQIRPYASRDFHRTGIIQLRPFQSVFIKHGPHNTDIKLGIVCNNQFIF